MPLFAQILLTAAVTLAAVAPLPADDPTPVATTELAPATELGALLFRDLAELEQRGDELIEAVGVPMSMRLSTLVQMGINWLGIQKDHVDPHRPVGIIATNHARPDKFDGLVLAVPFTDAEKIAADVDLKADPGRVGAVDIKNGNWDYWGYGGLDEQHLYLGGRNTPDGKAAVQSLLDDRPLAEDLPPLARERLDRSDILLHWGVATHRQMDPDDLKPNWDIDKKQLDEDELAIALQIAGALSQIKHLFFTITLEEGIAAHHRMLFDAGAKTPAARLLGQLRGASSVDGDQSHQPSLTGLPTGPVFAAGSTRLPEPQQQLLLRTIAKLFTHENGGGWGGPLWNWKVGAFTDLRQVVLLGALADVLPLTTESRFAIYPNGDGTFGVVVILEVDQPQPVVDRIRELSDFVAAGAVAGAGEQSTATVSDADIRRLIRQLGAESFSARNQAATRLLLLGARAHEHLTQAAASGDPEIAARAERLLSKFTISSRQREQRLLTDNPLVSAHPRLTYHVAAGELDGTAIDRIDLELPANEREQAEKLEEMFGTDWNHVQIAQTQRHVVLTFGTVRERLSQTLNNLTRGLAGLEDDPTLVQLTDDSHRLVKVHFPLSRFVEESRHRSWTRGEPRDKSPSKGLTAFGLSATDSEVCFDLHLPVEEVRGIVVKRGWSF